MLLKIITLILISIFLTTFDSFAVDVNENDDHSPELQKQSFLNPELEKDLNDISALIQAKTPQEQIEAKVAEIREKWHESLEQSRKLYELFESRINTELEEMDKDNGVTGPSSASGSSSGNAQKRNFRKMFNWKSSNWYSKLMLKLLKKVKKFDCNQLQRKIRDDYDNFWGEVIVSRAERQRAGAQMAGICQNLKRTVMDIGELGDVNRGHLRVLDESIEALKLQYKTMNPGEEILQESNPLLRGPVNFALCMSRSIVRGLLLPGEYLLHLLAGTTSHAHVEANQRRKYKALLGALVKLRDYLKKHVENGEGQQVGDVPEGQHDFVQAGQQNAGEHGQQDGAVPSGHPNMTDDEQRVLAVLATNAPLSTGSHIGGQQDFHVVQPAQRIRWHLVVPGILVWTAFLVLMLLYAPGFLIGFYAANIVDWFLKDCTGLVRNLYL